MMDTDPYQMKTDPKHWLRDISMRIKTHSQDPVFAKIGYLPNTKFLTNRMSIMRIF